jgi:DNA-binding SARP family transcriptional activator
MMRLRVSLFGQFHVQRGDEVLTDCCPRKQQELLCYLLLYRDRSHPRETLAGLLWGNSSTAQSKKNLRQTLWQLQAVTGSEADLGGKRLLLVDCDRVCLNADADLWLDVALFERAFLRTQGMSGTELDVEQAQALCQAADLYRGDLLEGWFHDWCLYERERLQNHYLAILDKLADYCEVRGEHESGLAYGALSLRYDGARERTHRRLMRLHYLVGDRTSALRQYDRCVEALHRELAVAPATRTVALYEQIRAGQYTSPRQRPVVNLDAQAPAASQLPQALRDLRQMQQSLTVTQTQLQQVIRSIELAMRE